MAGASSIVTLAGRPAAKAVLSYILFVMAEAVTHKSTFVQMQKTLEGATLC
jgi:hypothetical protein